MIVGGRQAAGTWNLSSETNQYHVPDVAKIKSKKNLRKAKKKKWMKSQNASRLYPWIVWKPSSKE
jgi:hypothetical protein